MKRQIPLRFSSLRVCAAVLLTAILLLSSILVHSQSAAATGRLEGTIADPSGAAVPDAEITVRNQSTGVSTVVHSTADGEFVVLYLDPGNYEVSIQKSGFGNLVLKDVAVSVGTRAILHPQLAMARVGETVSAGRDSPNRHGAIFSWHGGGRTEHRVTPAQRAELHRLCLIREFQVTSTGFEAEFGQSGGGLVNTVTKSGTNQVHGDAYYYILDSATSANDKINEQQGIAKPHNRRQQVGGTIGGPLVHNRFFYLGNFETQIRNEPLTVNDAPAVNELPPNFFANNRDLAAQVQAAAGSFPRKLQPERSFRQGER